MSGASIVLLGILVVSGILVVGFMMALRAGRFAKVEDVHERLAKERKERDLPTAALNSSEFVGTAGTVEESEPVEPAGNAEAEPQQQSQPQTLPQNPEAQSSPPEREVG